MKNKKIKQLMISAIFIFMISKVFASGVERYAVYIGSNKGGDGRAELLYAESDANNIKTAMNEVGGISEENSFLLINPGKKEIDLAMKAISEKMIRNSMNSNRSEFLFYYSGHSDEEALLLGNQKYDYESLKNKISEVPSDVHVVILDSCYSGNFIRTKGGKKKKPFLVDDSSLVKGHAYLSSSSESESSQESDEIGASYFTNSIVTGLRGAADTSGDKKVTLNELYSYAFNETLKKTEETKSGPQHPNYNITLVGSGDLVISDFSEVDSVMAVEKNLKGKLIFRNSNGKLISEINKNDDMPLMLALPQGNYSVTLIDQEGVFQSDVELKKNQTCLLKKDGFKIVEVKETTARGNGEEKKSRLQLIQENDIALGTFLNIPVIKGKGYISMNPFPVCFENIGFTALYEFSSSEKIHMAVGGTIGVTFAEDFLKIGPEVKVIFPVATSEKLLWNIETLFSCGLYPLAGSQMYVKAAVDLTMVNKTNKGFYSGFGFLVTDNMQYFREGNFKYYFDIDNVNGFVFMTSFGMRFFMGVKL